MKQSMLLLVGWTAILLAKNALALELYFWDVNDSAPGCGSPTPSGTWGVDAYWNKDDPDGTGSAGTNPTEAWPAGQIAVFAAGDDATGSYTVTVSSTQQVADIHVDLGDVTFTGGTLNLVDNGGANSNRLLSVGHKTDAAVARYNVPLTGATNIIRYKRATLILGATNTYTGSTTIEGGVIQLGAPHVMPSDSNFILANNDTTRGDYNPVWQYTPAVLATAGFSQNLGTLKLTGTDWSVPRVIDFGNGASALAFADSSAEDWSGFILTISNYTAGVDSLRFGTTAGGLTGTQVGLIQFPEYDNLPAQIDAQGFVTPALPVLLPPVRSDVLTVELSWTAVLGRTYRVQAKTNLSAAGWDDLADVYAFTSPASYSDTTATNSQRFYRVMVLP